ncbi:hypothetical protein ACQKWADRAFT_330568 [Trichoderma austrokoningii]
MAELFCCQAIKPYRPRRLDHEGKFDRFMQWAKHASSDPSDSFLLNSNMEYDVQLVKQANFGPKESIRYFTLAKGDSGSIEMTENDLFEANFEKLNSHHWRANLARPSTDIDLSLKPKAQEKKPIVGAESSTTTHSASDASGSNSTKAVLQADEHAGKFESTVVKSALCILLPAIKTNLGPKPLASLLCLDWVNEEPDLGLEIENDWAAQLTSRNIAAFIFDYARLSAAGLVTLAEIGSSVDLAIHRKSFFNKLQLPPGRKHLQEIVNQVLEDEATSRWVSKSREDMMRVFTTGPNEQLLELFQHDHEEQQISSLTDKLKLAAEDENDDDGSQYYDDPSSYEYCYGGGDNFGSYSSGSEHEDLTACDKECGYCGQCPY